MLSGVRDFFVTHADIRELVVVIQLPSVAIVESEGLWFRPCHVRIGVHMQYSQP